MVNETVRKLNPLGRRQEFLQVALDLHGIGLLRQTQQAGDPPDMGVDDNPTGNAKGGAQQDVGRLAADSGEFDQLVKSTGDLAVMLLHELTRHPADVRGFGPKESQRLDDRFDIRLGRFGECSGRGVLLKQSRSDRVDPLVRTLG